MIHRVLGAVVAAVVGATSPADAEDEEKPAEAASSEEKAAPPAAPEAKPSEPPAPEAKPARPEMTEEIVVTGSRVKRKDLTTPAPVTVVTPDEIVASGRTTVGELLLQLPEQGSALRGEGAPGEAPRSEVAAGRDEAPQAL